MGLEIATIDGYLNGIMTVFIERVPARLNSGDSDVMATRLVDDILYPWISLSTAENRYRTVEWNPK